mmetsp:Transcript_1268/g.2017  ORF Transcript_1268/g.2017 Transcript_1268/m.2017 type:complete len:122 (+) Transcript_1268:3335-3700(+)
MSIERVEIKQFKESVPFESRRAKSRKILEAHDTKYPLILLQSSSCRFKLPVQKFIIDGTMTVASLLYTIRKYIWVAPNQGLYLYLNDTLPMLNSKISELYQRFADEDGFLYFVYSHQEDKG